MSKTQIFRLQKNKRAVSPLIATVLLIAFAVALGAVVMNWGRGYVEETADFAKQRSDSDVKCSAEVDIDIVEIDDAQQICYNDTAERIEFMVENVKDKDIEKLQVRIIGEDSRVPNSTIVEYTNGDPILPKYEARFLNVSYDNDTMGLPSQVKITPIIRVGSEDITCGSTGLEFASVKSCAIVYG